ncbi:hypothetical protein [uncultured Pontibacter sp.]|uniref:hypothetical protein n=1 Tax=uncultured Pontibacter sp. TaxID=453356 RepID=UPI00261169E4|nr:hypothetical protein [uncultured Pontibacter sp.]
MANVSAIAMDNQKDNHLALFEQICNINALNPEAIKEEAQQRFPDKFENGLDVERLIWTAFDHRAKTLMDGIGNATPADAGKAAYTIDADPAAPAFMVNERNILSQYNPETARNIIDALGQVQMPVTG